MVSEHLTLVLLNKDVTPFSNFPSIRLFDPDCWYKFTYWMANSADPDQLASSEANWSGSTLFAKAVYIQVLQNKACPKTWNTSFYNLHLFSILIPHMKFQIQNLSAKCVKQRDGWLYEQPKMNLRSTYQNHISETHKVNIHKGKIRNVQTDRHGTKINGV